VKTTLAVTASTNINRNGSMFAVEALVSGLDQCWDTGLPHFIGHDHHRLIGWVVPLSVHIQPGLGRLTAVMQMPENAQEEEAVTRAFIASATDRITKTLDPVRSELKAKLQNFLFGEPKEAAPNCAAFVQEGLARRAFAKVFENEDKDGLVSVRGLKAISAGVFEIGGLFLSPNKFEVTVNESGAHVRAEIPKTHTPLFESQQIRVGRVALIRNSECSCCGKSYFDCLHSKYLDEGVIHQITSLDLLALFWSEPLLNGWVSR